MFVNDGSNKEIDRDLGRRMCDVRKQVINQGEVGDDNNGYSEIHKIIQRDVFRRMRESLHKEVASTSLGRRKDMYFPTKIYNVINSYIRDRSYLLND